MSSRFRNLLLAFGISLTMWAFIIHGTLSVYSLLQPGSDSIVTASAL